MRHVILTANDIDDYWTMQVGSPVVDDTPSASHLKTHIIDGVEPLDAQFGVDSPKTVPDALYEVLFRQPEPTGGEGKVELIHTYAILDAAKITNLPEMLADAGLEHRCLFKGDAFDELKDVAPWIVRLEDGNTFTRNLFTRSDAPWHLWGSDVGIYVRSHGTLEQAWKHFRKFVRVQGENGEWYFFAFWHSNVMQAVCYEKSFVSIAEVLLSGIDAFLFKTGEDQQCWTVFRLASCS